MNIAVNIQIQDVMLAQFFLPFEAFEIYQILVLCFLFQLVISSIKANLYNYLYQINELNKFNSLTIGLYI